MFTRLLSVVVAGLIGFAGPVAAAEFKVGEIAVKSPWARATPGKGTAGAAYVSVFNHGSRVDRLVAVSTPVAKKAELHTHLMENNVMKMRHVMAIEVHPGEPAVMRPGGLHVMLMGLNQPLKKGEIFSLTLTFERAGDVTVDVAVQRIGAMGPGKHDGHRKQPMDHGGMKHGS